MKTNTILIVDDSEFDRNLLVNALTKKGDFQTLEAINGDQCLQMLTTHKIDLVLMDIMMPGTFGTEVLMKIRKKFNAIELPIIMVTSKADASDVIGCLQSGANDYITKPVTFDVAVSRISTHLKLAEVSQEMSRLKEMAALDAMITTYNHEINTPLAIAISYISAPLLKDEASVDNLKSALWRIADIVKKIRAVTEQKEAEYELYAGFRKMIKVKNN
ncbi:MAG: response regulator [Bdellovibrionales bacterium]